MKKNFTLSKGTDSEQKNSVKTETFSTLKSGEDTLSFIRQFARVYQFEPALD